MGLEAAIRVAPVRQRVELTGLVPGKEEIPVNSTVLSPQSRQGHRPAPAARSVDPACSRRHNHQPTMLWKFLRFVVASSKDHAFLDRAWVPHLLRLCPRNQRRQLALHLLALSPHYWIYQWTNKYPARFSRNDVLEHEYQRNADSRRQLCDLVLRQFLRPEMAVLDFGCGPGFLARWASEYVAHIVASDVSRGVVACAGELNSAPNLDYVTNGVSDLRNVQNSSIDLAYSFAVFQHLHKEQTRAFLNEFARVLKPGGQGVCHTILKDVSQAKEYGPQGWVEQRVMLRMVYYTHDEWHQMLGEAGLENVEIKDVSNYADIDDDIGGEQLVTFRRAIQN